MCMAPLLQIAGHRLRLINRQRIAPSACAANSWLRKGQKCGTARAPKARAKKTRRAARGNELPPAEPKPSKRKGRATRTAAAQSFSTSRARPIMATCRDDKKTRRRRRNRNSIYTALGDETWASCCPNPPCPPTHYPRGKAREQGHRHRRRLLSLDKELEPQEVLQSTQIGLSKATTKPLL